MFLNLGPAEVLVILALALVVLGPDKLPQAARQMGRALSELRRMSSGFQAELRDAVREPLDGTPRRTADDRRPAEDAGPDPAGPS